MELVVEDRIRELDRRTDAGIEVVLLWEQGTDRVFVAVTDERTCEHVRFRVDAAHALDAFRHPYAYEAGAAA